MVGRRKRQFWAVDGEIAALEVEQAARAAEVVQQMTVDMQQIGIVADAENDMLVPDLVQHGTAGLFQGRSSLFEECRRHVPLTPFGTACIPSSCAGIKAQQVTPRLGPDMAR